MSDDIQKIEKVTGGQVAQNVSGDQIQNNYNINIKNNNDNKFEIIIDFDESMQSIYQSIKDYILFYSHREYIIINKSKESLHKLLEDLGDLKENKTNKENESSERRKTDFFNELKYLTQSLESTSSLVFSKLNDYENKETKIKCMILKAQKHYKQTFTWLEFDEL